MELRVFFICALLLVAPASFGGVKIIDTIGDTLETVCLASSLQYLWIGTAGGGMLRTDGTTTTRFDARHGLAGNRVIDCTLHAGRLFAATAHGLSFFDEETNQFQSFSQNRFVKLASAGDTLVAVDDKGRAELWSSSASRVVQVDLAIASLAGQSNGLWVGGGVDGRIYRSDRTSYLSARGPVLTIALRRGRVEASTPYGVFVEQNGAMRPQFVKKRIAFSNSGKTIDLSGLKDELWVRDVEFFQGTAFAATAAGLFRKIGGQWQPARQSTMPCGDRIASLAELDGALWVGSFDRGLCRLKDGVWTHYRGASHLASDMVNDMVSDGDRLWVATRSGLTVVNRSLEFEILTHEMCIENRRADCPWHAAVNGVAVDPTDGQVWIADVGAVHQVRFQRWKRYYKKLGLKNRSISRIAARDGTVAVGTTHQGVLFKKPNAVFETLGDFGGLADNWVMDLTFDTTGALWVATCTRGVSRYIEGRWKTFAAADGLIDDYTLSVKEIAGKMWVGSLSGLSILDDNSIINLTVNEGLSGNEVHDMLEYQGLIYLATDGGLTVLSID